MALNPYLTFHSLLPLFTHTKTIRYPASISNINFIRKHRILSAVSKDSDVSFEDDRKPRKNPKPRRKPATANTENPKNEEEKPFPTTIPRKPRRGRRSEAAAVEDFMRSSLEETFAAIREQNSEVLEGKENVIRERITDEEDDDDDDNGDKKEKEKKKKGMVVEEEDPNWPLDAEVGWGIRASEYFEKHPIKNVIGEDGVEIDWEGELDDNIVVKEINCLEWESFAFHPSPLIVLVFERYNRASENWRALKELEKAAKVYWNAKDRLPPRTVKLDMNIETDLAYALKIRECPQLLFLRGNRIIYREPQIRTADELVQMIAHFYYKARRPSWMKDAKLY
ncbi:thioredoxin-like fold domain-containing protein MRL7, chloroplastic [Lactuca sativa]|uniref:Thioredoxin domain-containing protein n=1 Tax=Lactuca sativa TaxID=4236 RepID=A0A9R1VK94_LACSA|nr:thioredoxin-like fold domain-containing protein MRL7, chloroplastic [Lactuca sativa]KAJ0207871.1 hypothetical protein LSAT_V11C500295050 [Lactuca sativa]